MIKDLIFKLIVSKKLIKVYHLGCGGHVGYVADTDKTKRDANNFYFLDGSHPKEVDKISIPCNKCGKIISYICDLVLIDKV